MFEIDSRWHRTDWMNFWSRWQQQQGKGRRLSAGRCDEGSWLLYLYVH